MKKKTITGKIPNFCIKSCENKHETYASNAPVRISKNMSTYCYKVESEDTNLNILQIKHSVDQQFGTARLNLKIVKEGKLPKIEKDSGYNCWDTRRVKKYALISSNGSFSITLGDKKAVIKNKDEKRSIKLGHDSFYRYVNGKAESITKDIDGYHVADIIVSEENMCDKTILLEIDIVCTDNDALKDVFKMLEEF